MRQHRHLQHLEAAVARRADALTPAMVAAVVERRRRVLPMVVPTRPTVVPMQLMGALMRPTVARILMTVAQTRPTAAVKEIAAVTTNSERRCARGCSR